MKQKTTTSSIQNKKAFHDYFIDEKFEAGIALMGPEVKSIRNGKAALTDAYVRLKQGEAYIVNMYIAPYECTHHMDLDSKRSRKLLLHKKELIRLTVKMKEKGLTIIPLRLYFNARNKAKVEIALGKGKQKFDKRQDLKKKVQQREVDRAMRHR